jgi:uncharacterized protein (TIGR03435 family)
MKLIGIVVVIAVGLGRAQTGTAGRPTFEVASVKPTKPGTRGFNIHINDGGLTASNAGLQALIRMAYQVKDYQLFGAPNWLNTENFDIVAKVPPGAKAKSEQVMSMLQTLLADRFKLAVHRETKVLQGYALVLAKSGSKLHVATVPEEIGIEKPLFNGQPGNLTAERITMALFADNLAKWLNSPVSEMTGLQGVFQLHLEWTPEGRRPVNTQAGNGEAAPAEAPGIFTALQEQLGLKLETRTVPAEIVAIDHVEKAPTD